ncbi:DUF1542 domain-containing protein [Fructobacillus sp. M1-13]|uniref:DUF1542 domain-containing protein n=1 Tax=Fructobacillus papyriferae TaxID=2713171 RepID=A0ABS5QRK5_9LACO|nr:DUF1542 domain-containing protein [Fructobacillus papyriferae]MBS9334949.1 DUF1542 domain-containing protein [Fructobacillus papyriferae]MCD2159567.1 DUF1542 domain-containing protein [Fructobacillus papyriferae]
MSGKAATAKNDFDQKKAALDNDVQKHKSLADQKKDIQEDIKQKADQKRADINDRKDLTNDEKAKAKAAIDAAEKKANESLKPENTPDAQKLVDTPIDGDFDKAAQDVQKDLDQHDSFAKQKSDANQTISAEADQEKRHIEGQDGLTRPEKDKLAGDVDHAADKAYQALKGIDNAEDLEKAKKTSFESLQGDLAGIDDTVKNADLSKKKDAAKNNIDDLAFKAKGKINGRDELSDDEKSTADKAVDGEAFKAKAAIDNSKNADDLNQQNQSEAFAKKADQVEQDSVDNGELNTKKKSEKLKIDDKSQHEKDAIEKRNDLNQAEKRDQKKRVDDAAKKAKDDLDKIVRHDDLDKSSAALDYQKTIDGLHDEQNQHASLADQKKAAEDKLDDRIKANEGIIDGINDLSGEEKARAKEALNQQAEEDRKRIKNSANADVLGYAADLANLNVDDFTKPHANHPENNGAGSANAGSSSTPDSNSSSSKGAGHNAKKSQSNTSLSGLAEQAVEALSNRLQQSFRAMTFGQEASANDFADESAEVIDATDRTNNKTSLFKKNKDRLPIDGEELPKSWPVKTISIFTASGFSLAAFVLTWKKRQ